MEEDNYYHNVYKDLSPVSPKFQSDENKNITNFQEFPMDSKRKQEEMDLLARIENLEKNIDESASKILNIEKETINREIPILESPLQFHINNNNNNCNNNNNDYENQYESNNINNNEEENEEIIYIENYPDYSQRKEKYVQGLNGIDKMQEVNEEKENKIITENNNDNVRISKMNDNDAEIMYKERMKEMFNKLNKAPNKNISNQEQKNYEKINSKNKNIIQNRRNMKPKKENTKEIESKNSKMKSETKTFNKNNNNIKYEIIPEETNIEPRGIYLYYRGLEKLKEKIELNAELIKRKEIEKLKECTFSPSRFLTKKAQNLKNYENIVDKTKKFEEKLQNKEKENEVKKLINETKNCTFSPQINKKSRNSLYKSSSCEDFYKKQLQWKKKVETSNLIKSNQPKWESIKKSKKIRNSNINCKVKEGSENSNSAKKLNNNKFNTPKSTRSEFGIDLNPNGKISNILNSFISKTNIINYSKESLIVSPSKIKLSQFTNKPIKETICKEINDTMYIFKNIRNQMLRSKDLSLSFSLDNSTDRNNHILSKNKNYSKIKDYKLKSIPTTFLIKDQENLPLNMIKVNKSKLENKYLKLLDQASQITRNIKKFY